MAVIFYAASPPASALIEIKSVWFGPALDVPLCYVVVSVVAAMYEWFKAQNNTIQLLGLNDNKINI